MKKPTQKHRYHIGIDPGVNTGIAIWDSVLRKFEYVKTLKIHNALQLFSQMPEGERLVIVEDARKRKHDKGLTPEKAQGAGSVKRDCKIWEDFLTDLNIPFQLKAPNGKLNALAQASNLQMWQRNTKWTERTSEHARCAAMLVWNI